MTLTTQKTEKTPRPFRYRKREARHTDTQQPCACCGHAVVTSPGVTTNWVHVVDGGASYGGAEDTNDAGDMGWFPVGPSCAKRLRKAGVYVQTNEGKSAEQQLRDALTFIASYRMSDAGAPAGRVVERFQQIAREALRSTTTETPDTAAAKEQDGGRS